MSGYLRPVDAPVSCSWQCHRDRTPPSSEPGTDYACPYGTPVLAADPGTVTDVQTAPATATGRYVTVQLDDGRTTRDLHLSAIAVTTGQRVERGQWLGWSGASGYGLEYYYGPHLHRTLWPGDIWAAPTIDFELYVGTAPTPPPPPEEDDMPKNSGYYYEHAGGSTVYGICNTTDGFLTEWSGSTGEYNNAMATAFDTPPFAKISQHHRDAIAASCQAVRVAQATTLSQASTSRVLAILAASAIVQVVGLILVAWLT